MLFGATAIMAQEAPLPMSDDGYFLVSTAKELQRAVKSDLSTDGSISYSKIRLTADIYLSEIPEGTLNNTFSGTIDGLYTYTDANGVEKRNGYTIYGGHENELNEEKLRKCSYLFTNLRSATFQNVRFKNIYEESKDHDNQGIIAQQAWDSHFNLVCVDSCSVFCDDSYAGILLGRAERCVFETVCNSFSDVKVYGEYAGGFVGYSKNCQFYTCTTSKGTSVFADGNNWDNHAYCGGFTGYSVDDKFNSCTNTALVGAAQCQVGGFAGQSEHSDFYNCKNIGMVCHTGEGTFDKMRKDERFRLKEIKIAYDDKPAAFVGSMISGFILGTPAGMLGWLDLVGAAAVMATTGAWVILAAALVGGAIGTYIFLGDDEVGGICGLANGGTFEMCGNFASLRCRDDNGGGIVGLGYGVTINNCFSSGEVTFDEESKGGAIIGNAQADKNDSNKKTKVTNCCANIAYHLIGNDKGLDPASGNNYRLSDNGKTERTWCEEAVSENDMKSGLVAYWLNQSPENRVLKPWRQKLTCDPNNPNDTIIDLVPSLVQEHPVITMEDLGYTEISDAAQLMAFAEDVNNGNHFARAILTNDINMAGIDNFEPIGMDHPRWQFRGIFDGKGHKISGLKYTSDMPAGLFGSLHANAEIRNVVIDEDCEFTNTGDEGAGGIVGRVDINWKWGNVFIENCANYADINVINHGGGILGRVSTRNTDDNVKVYVNNCYNMGTITAGNGNSGLLCGYMKHTGVVSNSWSYGELKTASTTYPFSIENPKGGEHEHFAGYDWKIDLNNCFTFISEDKVDMWQRSKGQAGVTDFPDSTFLTSGTFVYLLNGQTNNPDSLLTWQQNLGSYPELGNKGLYHSRSVSSEYGTVCLPYALMSSDDIRYYTFRTVKEEDGSVDLVFEYTDKVAAAQPALFRVKSTGEVNFSDASESQASYMFRTYDPDGTKDWEMLGTFTQQVFDGTDAESIYYISGGKIKNAKKVTIAPFRAYISGLGIDELNLSAGGNANVRIVIEDEDGEVTAIQMINDDDALSYDNDNFGGKTYSVMGTEVGEGYRGVVIRNGKKYIRK